MRRAFVVVVAVVVGCLTALPALAVPPAEPGRIVYTRSGYPEVPSQLVTVAADGTDFQPIIGPYRSPSGPFAGRYSPNGRWLAYLNDESGIDPHYALRLARADGSGATDLSVTGEVTGPTWSPDGLEVAVYSNDSREIVIAGPGTRRTVTLDAPPCAASSLAWSPDGARFALGLGCLEPDDPAQQVWVVNVDGTEPRQLTRLQGWDVARVGGWSPDGSQILFGTHDGIWIIDADGSGQRQVPGTGELDVSARWSPDGTEIVFTRWSDGSPQRSGSLFRVRNDGTGLQRISTAPDRILHTADDWQPVPAHAAPACPDGQVPRAGFVDVTGAHATAVDCMAWHGLAQGRSADRYAPGDVVRRDQVASFLARLLERAGVDLPAPRAQGFGDIDGNRHADAINQLAELGILTGFDASTFGPSQPMTRAQMASLLVRTYEHAADARLPRHLDEFADDDGTRHEPAIDRAAFAGFTSGVTVSRYEPTGQVRRDQMATFLARVTGRLVQEGHAQLPDG